VRPELSRRDADEALEVLGELALVREAGALRASGTSTAGTCGDAIVAASPRISSPSDGRASAHYGDTPVSTWSQKSSLQPHARRFIAMLSLAGCCLSSDRAKRLSHAKFSRVLGSRMRDSSSRNVTSRLQ